MPVQLVNITAGTCCVAPKPLDMTFAPGLHAPSRCQYRPRTTAPGHGHKEHRRRPRSAVVPSATELAAWALPEQVKQIFSTFNGLLLLPWPLMIFAPNASFTKAIIRSNLPFFILAGFYAYHFAAAAAQSTAAGQDLGAQVVFLFTEAVADPAKMAMMSENNPAYAAQDWVHLCLWDYWVGSYIYLQGLEKGVFTAHSLVLTFNTGPFGLVSHLATEAITLKLRSNADFKTKLEETRQIAAEQDAKIKASAGDTRE